MVVYGIGTCLMIIGQCWAVAHVVNMVFHQDVHFESIRNVLFVILGFMFGRAIIQFFCEWYFRLVAHRIKTNIRMRKLNHLFNNPVENKITDSAGGQAAVFCEMADSIDPFFSEFLPQVYSAAIIITGILICAFIYDKLTFVIMAVTVPLLPFFLSLIGSVSSQMNKDRISSLKRLGSAFMDSLNGLKTLKSFGQSKVHGRYIFNRSEAFRITTMDVLKVSFLSALVLELAATVSIALLAVSFGFRLFYGKMPFEEAFFLLLIAPELYFTVRQFGAKYHTAMNSKSAADALLEKEDPLLQNGNFINLVTRPEKKIKEVNLLCKNVTVSYTDTTAPALKNVSLLVNHTDVAVLMGHSGAGKSTLAGAIMGLLPVTSGEILLNGISLGDYSKKELYQLISYVPQRTFIINDSLIENLRFVKPEASLEEIRYALERASLLELEKVLPDGLQTIISEDGRSISRGQAQRISIARAFLKNSPFIILDEPTSALDMENEEKTIDSIFKLSENRTVLIITHRMTVINKADIVYLLDKGCVVERGSPEQLLNSSNMFKSFTTTWAES
jgi:ATP-binding cassette subfamily C protein CydD